MPDPPLKLREGGLPVLEVAQGVRAYAGCAFCYRDLIRECVSDRHGVGETVDKELALDGEFNLGPPSQPTQPLTKGNHLQSDRREEFRREDALDAVELVERHEPVCVNDAMIADEPPPVAPSVCETPGRSLRGESRG